jgi:hypothetical protein
LKLNPSQEASWQTWSDQVRKNKVEWKSHQEEDSNDAAKALDRLEQKLTRLKQIFDSKFAKHGGKHRPPGHA